MVNSFIYSLMVDEFHKASNCYQNTFDQVNMANQCMTCRMIISKTELIFKKS